MLCLSSLQASFPTRLTDTVLYSSERSRRVALFANAWGQRSIAVIWILAMNEAGYKF